MKVNQDSQSAGTPQKLDTRIRQEQIAQAALKLVGRDALKGLSIAGIAREIGLVPSAIYRHFPNKDAVIDAVLDLIRARLLGNVRQVRRETDDPLEQLERLLMRHIALIRENAGIPRIVFSEDVYADQPERRQRVYQMVQAYLDRVGEIVAQGQERGQMRTDTAPRFLAVMFLGLVQPAAILYHMSDGDFDVQTQAEQSWKVFRRAVAVPMNPRQAGAEREQNSSPEGSGN